jgi:multidrug efflux pump subunit AcrA (membrane-fusion protein)
MIDSTEVRYSGVVAADTQVDLSFRVAGYVEAIGTTAGRELQQGDWVESGTVLARLRSSEYQTRVAYSQAVAADATASLSALEAQLHDAETGLTHANRDFERANTLFAEKAMTKADFDAAEARRNSAAARKDAAAAQAAAQRARIEGAGAQRAEAALNLGDTALTAPFSGVIVAKRVARGTLVSPGMAAFVIADTRVAKVSFGVPDLARASFKSGASLSVSAEAVPGRRFTGRVSSVSPAADPASRVFAIEVAIPNADRLLSIGMVATVVVAGGRETPKGPSVPLSAVVKGPNGYAVYTVENNRARLQPVTLGAVKDNAVLITTGLNSGQRVISSGGLQLVDGEEVRQIP